ncbi:50S ribosomal protein L24, partial [Francisella tularensis subsp. holarctica]|nr:50S ribosomal protein L24 [Francisella tularensis subsp. holarctica]
ASNVAIFNPATEKSDRVCYKFVDEKKVRYFKSTGELVDL